MNNVLMYGGLALAVVFFLITVFLFFYQKIPSVIKYFYNIRNKKVFKNSHGYKVPKQKPSKKKVESTKAAQPVKQEIQDERTQLLDIAQNYATALLDADSTELLPELDEN